MLAEALLGPPVSLPALIDCRTLMAELGVKRAEAERLMRAVPRVHTGSRRWYVNRADLEQHLETLNAERRVA